MSALAPIRFRARVVFSVITMFVLVCALGIPVAPQEMRPATPLYEGAGLFRANLAARLVASGSFQNALTTPAAVLFVFFSSESSSLYSRGEPHTSGLTNGGLGASLTRTADMDALLGSTSLVPESPAWEPILPNVGLSRITVFPAWRKRTQGPAPIWFHNATPTHDYYVNSPALVVW